MTTTMDVVFSGALRGDLPSDDDTHVAAYYRWLNGGCREDGAEEDWHEAQRDLMWAGIGVDPKPID